jgi:ribosomal-protein-alanine N-acetyltransferase
MSDTVFIEGDLVILRPLCAADATPAYLSWLNDEEVLRFRGPKAFPSTMESLQRYIAGIPDRGDLVLAVCTKADGRHVGNIALNSINWLHRSAELSIMIGARDTWGKGYGKQAMALVTRHAFRNMGLNRIWAESPNPAFNGAVRSLGWVREGTKRQAFLLDGAYVDHECWSLLAAEFKSP